MNTTITRIAVFYAMMLNEAVAKRDLASKARVSILFNKGN
jgi:hypothetical protein